MSARLLPRRLRGDAYPLPPPYPRAARFKPPESRFKPPESWVNPPESWVNPPGPRAIPGIERIVYFPSCAARTMGPQRGDDAEPLPVVAERLFRKAGFDVVYPRQLAGLCCGQPFESQGL